MRTVCVAIDRDAPTGVAGARIVRVLAGCVVRRVAVRIDDIVEVPIVED